MHCIGRGVQDRDLGRPYIWAYNQKTASPEEIIGKTDEEIFTAEEAARIRVAKERVLREGIEVREQMWLERPGGRMYLDVTHSPVRNEAGEIVGVSSATIDLTAIKIAEGEIQLSEEKFARAFADNPAAIALARLEDMVFIDVNETLTSLSGYSREEMIGRSAYELNLWSSAPHAERLKTKLLQEGSLQSVEQVFRKKSGELVATNLWAQFLEVNGEKLVLATAVDITEAKWIEAELTRAKVQAERSAAQLRTIFENIGERLYVCDGEGNPIIAYEAMGRTLLRPDGSITPVSELEQILQISDLNGRPLPHSSNGPFHGFCAASRFRAWKLR